MLVELSIRDLALIEEATLEFGPGLNVVTGETGAGKSLLIGALELLLGHRPRGRSVRQGARRAQVEGRFVFPADGAQPRLRAWLEAHRPDVLEDVGGEDELELVLSRTLAAEGGTRAHLDHRPITQRRLRELSGLLVEIHGQNDHQKLLEPAEQLRLIDAYGELGPRLEAYREARRGWLALAERVAGHAARAVERRDRLDLLRFQTAELEEAAPAVEEGEELTRERARLRHAEELARALGSVVDALAEGDAPALDLLRRAEREVGAWEDRVTELGAPAAALREAAAQLDDACDALRRFLDDVEASPARLEEVEARLAELERLQRKYRADLRELEALGPRLRAELEALEGEEHGLDELERELEAARIRVEERAARLGAARRKLRPRLVRAVHAALADLGLERARLDVVVEPRAARAVDSPNASPALARHQAEARRLGPEGADRVELRLSANPGEGLAPLSEVASGGEAARVMLALRGALAARQTIPTLVFDEIDAGVGGRLAPKVGAHLRALGAHDQILCVTHLPAVAAAAHQHWKVEKRVARGRTRTTAAELAGEARVAEVADMIAGGAEVATAQAEARRLLAEVGP